MRRFLTRLATGLHVATFAVFCLALSHVILLQFGVSAVQNWSERRWPNSERARAFRFWFGLLAPVVVLAFLLAALGFGVAHLRAIQRAE